MSKDVIHNRYDAPVLASLDGTEEVIFNDGGIEKRVLLSTVFAAIGFTAGGLTASEDELNLLDDAPATIDIALTAGASNVMTITITVEDAAGVAIDAVHELEWWISDAATGIGLTADSFSGDVATTTGTEWEERTSKKHYTGLTDVNGVLVATVEDTNTPADIYVAARHPLTGKIIVSAASGANWGA